MRQARAVPLPNETLHIEEIKFWLKMMQDHTQFIRSGLPSDCNDFIEASKEFHKAFCSVMQKAEKLKSVKQSGIFIQEVTSIMEEFCSYQQQILAERLSGKMQGNHFPFFLDHLLREARCFTAFLQRLQEVKTMGKSVSHTKEVVVWLRFMSDHTKLMAQYLDPSEYRMRKIANDFSANFDQLVLQARCLSSMLYCQRNEVRAFQRFLLDVRLEVQKLRDFHKTAEELIADCRLLGVATMDLATHMRRESEHCLLIIALMEKELVKHRPNEFYDDVDADIWIDPGRAEDSEKSVDIPPESNEDMAIASKTAEVVPEKAIEPIIEKGEPLLENRAIITPVLTPEPVVAILSLADGKTVIPEEKATVADKSIDEIKPLIIDDNQVSPKPVVLEKPLITELPQPDKTSNLPKQQPEASQVAAEEKAFSGAVIKRERLYAKASDYKLMPNKFAGATPGERCINEQKGMRLPRPLGKKD